MDSDREYFPFHTVASGAMCVALVAACLLLGRYPSPGFISPGEILSDPVASMVVFRVRLPRVAAALILGAVMAASGNAFQLVFSNPLIEPGFLGVSQGASFGAALALAAGLGDTRAVILPREAWVALSAFAFAILGLFMAVRLSRAFRFGGQILRLVLSGIAVSAVFSSFLAAIKYAADPLKTLPDITYWTMGSLLGIGWERLGLVAPVCAACLVGLWLFRWRMTLLSLDESVAQSLGVRFGAERLAVLVLASAGVAAVTAAAGVVSWIGLVVPHLARMRSGPDARKSFAPCVLLGAAFTLVCDTAARSLFPGEIPLGAVTALFGACAFSVLASRGKFRVSR